MRNLLRLLFKDSSVPAVQAAPVNIAQKNSFFTEKSASDFYNTLVLLMPPKALQDIAFDDFHPSVFYAVSELPNSEGFISEIENLRLDLQDALKAENFQDFENSISDNIYALSLLKFLMVQPAGAYKSMLSRIHCDEKEPIFKDAATNTRYGSWYYNEGIKELIDTITAFEDSTGEKFVPPSQALLDLGLALPGPAI